MEGLSQFSVSLQFCRCRWQIRKDGGVSKHLAIVFLSWSMPSNAPQLVVLRLQSSIEICSLDPPVGLPHDVSEFFMVKLGEWFEWNSSYTMTQWKSWHLYFDSYLCVLPTMFVFFLYLNAQVKVALYSDKINPVWIVLAWTLPSVALGLSNDHGKGLISFLV